jgi:hypothetical protein
MADITETRIYQASDRATMATQQPLHTVEELPDVPSSVDLPPERTYETETNAALDQKLCDAIRAAKTADNDYLSNLLAFELGSHYHQTR